MITPRSSLLGTGMETSEFIMPSGYECLHERRVALVVRREWAQAARKALSPLPHAWEKIRLRTFTARGRAGIVSFPLGDTGATMMVRRYMHGGLLAAVTRDLYFGPERALEELDVAEVAHKGGVRTTEPLGVLLQEESGPFWRLAYLSMEVGNSEDLIHYCCRLTDYPPETAALEKRGVIREAARQIRKMHDIGIFHGDLHLKNLLLQRQASDTPKVYIIDFDRAKAGPSLSVEERFKNLARLARSIRKVRVANTLLTTWDRLRFLREYVRGMPDERALMRRWARKLAVSGRSHEIWWTATRAQRALRGDRIDVARRLRAGGSGRE